MLTPATSHLPLITYYPLYPLPYTLYPNNMLARKYRFRGLGSVRPALKRGQRIRGAQLAASVLKTNRESPRFAVLVSKKVSKKAVVRNRIRRRVLEAIRTYKLDSISPHDVVFSAFDSRLAELPWSRLKSEVDRILKKAGLIQ